jgi:pimeloyl-ACP methyl ester carboxylesterase
MTLSDIIALIASLSAPPDPTAFQLIHAGGANPATPITVSACPQPIGSDEIEGKTVICGTISVPENHSNPDGRKIEIEFGVLKSKSTAPEPDPVIHLHGGPAGGMMDALAGYAGIFADFRRTRDVIFFDQRAAGLSDSSVACSKTMSVDAANVFNLPGTDPDSNQAFDDCLAELKAAGVDVAAYNTTQNALDVRDIIAALGYESYNIYGISYGTKLALEVERSAPERLRAVIIDGVVPLQVHDYDQEAVPGDEVLDLVIGQCEADAACSAAYPDLRKITTEILDQAAAGTLMNGGDKLSVGAVVAPVIGRNGQRSITYASMTPYIPAYLYEIYRNKPDDSPAMDLLSKAGFRLPLPTADDVSSAAADLPADQRKLVDAIVGNATDDTKLKASLQQNVWDLLSAVKADAYGPIVQLFDTELTTATEDLLKSETDKAALTKLLSDLVASYVALQTAEPSRDGLAGFVQTYFKGPALARLQGLVAAMSDGEIEGSFALIRSSSRTEQGGFLQGAHMAIYICQESVPYNSPEGLAKVADTLKFKPMQSLYAPAADAIYEMCKSFTPTPREGFHDAVTGDIPTLAIGSMWDTQTAPSWAALAASTLSKGQSVLIPESGHGAIIYQPCAVDMGVAFLNNPERKLVNSCAETIKVQFYIAPWVATDAAAAGAKAS